MTTPTPAMKRKDLIIYVDDDDIWNGVDALLKHRQKSLKIRHIEYEIHTCDNHDSGCFHESVDFLATAKRFFNHAMVLFDRAGSGQEQLSCIEIESHVKSRLIASGWQNKAEVVVFDPEFDIWVWSDSPHVVDILNWSGSISTLYELLIQNGFMNRNSLKPDKPKEALEFVLKTARKPWSGRIFNDLGRKVSLNRCQDVSFTKFKSILVNWFGLPNGVLDIT